MCFAFYKLSASATAKSLDQRMYKRVFDKNGAILTSKLQLQWNLLLKCSLLAAFFISETLAH